jgi:predicted dehydrogenase
MKNYSRRKFLAQITATGALLSLPNIHVIGKSKPQDRKLGVALVGLGYYAEHKIATALQETKYCELKGIVTGTPAKATKWKEKYNLADGSIYNYQNFDKIIDNKSIDVIYVVLPNSMHHEFVIRAAKAGKQVITEKPMGVSSKECEEMIAACKKAGVKLYVGYRMQFEPHTQEVMRVAQQKEFGAIKVVETSMGFKIGDPTQWRLKKALAGGGAMMDVGIYAIQGARYSTAEEPISVTAREFKTDKVKFKDVDETIFWQMEFPSGAVANCMTSYATHMERLFMSAENGWMELRPAFGYGPISGRTHKGPLDIPHTNHQALQLDGMAQAIMQSKEIRATGEEGLRDAKIIEAIYKSIATGKKITLS